MSSGALRSFAHRRFAIVWTGLACSAVGTWVQIVAQSLVTLKITHGSAFALGAVLLSQAAAFLLFALAGGGIADAFDRRKLLLVSQTVLGVLAALLGYLTASGRIELWMLLVLAFSSGCVLSADQPARAALLPSLVPDSERTNAIALQSMIFQGASIAGPTLAGLAAASIGYAGCFYFNAVSYLAVLIALLVAGGESNGARQSRQRLIHAVAELFDALKADPVLRATLSGYAAVLFLTPSSLLLLPVLAGSVWHISDAKLGALFACSGIGAVAGALLVAHRGDRGSKSVPYLVGLFASAVALGTFPSMRPLWAVAALLMMAGVGQAATSVITAALLQGRVPAGLRGRVMSLNTLLVMGIRPLGDFPEGWLIHVAGPQRAALLCAALIVVAGLLLLPRRSPFHSV